MLFFNAKVIEVVPTVNVVAPDTAKVPEIVAFPATLVVPVIAAPPDETVKPVHVRACNDVVPDVTVKPDEDVKPVQTIAFVVSNPLEYFLKFGPTVVINENIIGELDI